MTPCGGRFSVAEIAYIEGLFGTYEKRFSGELREPFRRSPVSHTGFRFGRLVAREYLGVGTVSDRKRGASVMGLDCDCGVQIAQFINAVRQGDVSSCGCLAAEARKRMGADLSLKLKRAETLRSPEYREKRRTNHERTAAYGEASFKEAFGRHVYSAKKRNLAQELTHEMFRHITQQDCYMCGSSPGRSVLGDGAFGAYVCNGIDRLDNAVGYSVKNCRACCWLCNRLKFKSDVEAVIDHARKIVSYQSCADLF